jgi:hypothetical protein
MLAMSKVNHGSASCIPSSPGGQAAGNLLTLIASARLHRLDPEAYMRDVFRLLPHWPRTAVTSSTGSVHRYHEERRKMSGSGWEYPDSGTTAPWAANVEGP